MDGGPSVVSVPGSILSGGTEHDEAFSESAAGASLPTGVHLQLLFQYYCRFGRSGTDHDIDTLDNAMYAKFTRDCPGLLTRPLSAADCDLLFVKHKAKPLRRITYGQWLDILSEMAALKYPDPSEASGTTALTRLLAGHILCSSPALGIAEAVRGGLIRVEAAASGPVFAGPRARSPSRGRSPSARSPAGARVTARSQSPSLRTTAGAGAGAAAAASAASAAPTPSSSSSSSSAAFASYMQAAAAQMAALAAQAVSAADAVTAAAQATAEGGSGAGAPAHASDSSASVPSPTLTRAVSPSAAYQVLARTAKDFQVAAATAAMAAAAGQQQQQQQQQQQRRTASPQRTENLQHSMQRLSSSQRSGSGGGGGGGGAGSYSASIAPHSNSSAVGSLGGSSSSSSSASGGGVLRLTSPNPFRAVPLANGEFVISSQSLGSAGSGASRPHVPPRSPGGGRYDHLGTPLFTPALAGEANAPGSVYERLANPESFTGVYRRAWETDGRINQYSDTSASLKPSAFVGNTNTGTDETITDIRTTLRPNLSHQPALGVNRVSGRPAFR